MTLLYGLIGEKLNHSFSKSLFEANFSAKTHTYSLFELSDLAQWINLCKKTDALSGFNVTIPFKEAIIPYLNQLDPISTAIEAVNTVKITRSNEVISLRGYNTDAIGFEKTFKGNPAEPVLILGSGGACKSVAYVLSKKNIPFQIASRNNPKCLHYEDLNLTHYRHIINTTPLGMFPNLNTQPKIPYHQISPQHSAYDLVYNPEETLFLKQCKLAGAQTKNGLEMLKIQAHESWKIWGISPNGSHEY